MSNAHFECKNTGDFGVLVMSNAHFECKNRRATRVLVMSGVHWTTPAGAPAWTPDFQGFAPGQKRCEIQGGKCPFETILASGSSGGLSGRFWALPLGDPNP